MLALALAYAEGLDPEAEAIVYYGAHSGDHHIYPDCRPEFIRAMSATMLHASDGRVILTAPFRDISKTGILTEGLKIGLRPEDYARTWSCYEGGERPCGQCGACQERAEAFRDNEVIDPLVGV
jgi:7-cyano-7-deazaguanine synthase